MSKMGAQHRGRRGARLARRDDREYREYLREEQRRQAGCIAGRMPPPFCVWVLGPSFVANTCPPPATLSYTATGSNRSSILPSLSANESRRTPTRSSSVRWRFASAVPLSYVMWRPPFMPHAAPPATRIGRFSGTVTVGFALPPPSLINLQHV